MENQLPEEETPDLPSFMSEDDATTAENTEGSWISNNLHKVMSGVSVFWFLIVGIYITKFYGWANMFLLTPGEFGGFLAGITLPLAVIWMVIAYIDRGSGFKAEAKLLRAYMNQLVYPEEGAASTAKAMADAIREQVAELQSVTMLATEKTNEIKFELSSRVDDFAKLVQVLNEYSNKTINELNLGVNALIENCNFVTSQTKNMTDDFIQSAEKIKTQVSDLTVGMTPMLQDVRNMAITLNELTNDNQKKISSANERFIEYTNLFSHLNENITKIEQSIVNQRKAVEQQAEVLDKNSKYLDGKLGEYGKIINMEVEAMLANSATLDENIQKHIQGLKNTADEISSVFDNVHQEIDKRSSVLMNASKVNAESIIASSKLVDNEMKKLEAFTSAAGNKNTELCAIAEKTANTLQTIGTQIASNTDILRNTAVETLDVFNEVSGSLRKNTLSLTETSSQIANQAKKGNDFLSATTKDVKEITAKVDHLKNELEKLIAVFAESSVNAEKAVDRYENKVAAFKKATK